jgi:DNA-binding MarR family transcriptional regulator
LKPAARQINAPDQAEPERLDQEISRMPGHLIRRMHQASQAIFDNHVSAGGYDLTSVQFAALTVIASKPGLDQASLARELSFDRATTGGVIDRLENKHLIRREVSATDRRARLLFLEAEGERVMQSVLPLAREAQSDMVSALSVQERALFLELLAKALGHAGEQTRTSRSS